MGLFGVDINVCGEISMSTRTEEQSINATVSGIKSREIRSSSTLLHFIEDFFEFFVKKLSYSGAAAFVVMAFGWLCVGYGYLLVRSLSDAAHLNEHDAFWIAVTICGVTFTVLCLIFHGAGSAGGQGAWNGDLRLLNRCFSGFKLHDVNALKEAENLSLALSNMPRFAARRTIFWGAAVIITTTLGESMVSGTTVNSSVVGFSGVMSILMMVGYSYLVTELYSATGRARLKQLCYKFQVPIHEPPAVSIKAKFIMFAFFLLYSLVTLAGVTLHGTSNWGLLLGCVFFSFLAGGILMALTTISILKSLEEIFVAADDLAAGGEGQIFSSSLDREIIYLADFLNKCAREINATREHLEDVVNEKTEELRLAVKEACRASEAKGRFLASMSHEIRTPLNAILGMTGLLQESKLDAEQREFIGNIDSSGGLLLDLINNVLDFSRFDVGKAKINRIEFDLRDVIDSTVNLLAERAHRKGLELVSYVFK